jgi:anti-sigma B factor antagonist
MNITENRQGPISTFTLQGRVDSEGAVELDRALHEALGAGRSRIILDLSQVAYINSAGLRILADVLTQNQANGGDLVLVAPSSRVRRVFQIVGFDRFFRVFDSMELAVREL